MLVAQHINTKGLFCMDGWVGSEKPPPELLFIQHPNNGLLLSIPGRGGSKSGAD